MIDELKSILFNIEKSRIEAIELGNYSNCIRCYDINIHLLSQILSGNNSLKCEKSLNEKLLELKARLQLELKILSGYFIYDNLSQS